MRRLILLTPLLLALVLLALPLTIAARSPDITVSLNTYSPQPIQPGQTMDLSIEVANSGDPAEQVTLEILEDYPFTVERAQDYERAQGFGPIRNTQTLQFRVSVDEDANDGVTPLRIRYSVDGGATIEETFTINVETFDARIDIIQVRQEPESLAPGQEGTLYLTLTNGADTPLENVDVVLDLTNSYDVDANMENILAVQAMLNARLEEVNRRVAAGLSPLKGATPMGVQEKGSPRPVRFDALAPVGMSNQQRLGRLAPGENVEVAFRVQAMPDAATTIHALPVYVNYNDEENNPFHVRVDVPFVVNEAPTLYVELKESSLRTTDFAGTVTFSIANRGEVPLKYTSIALEESEEYTILTAPSSHYIGTLQPGEEREATFTILPETDEVSLPVALSYRDAYNGEHEEMRTLSHTIINRNYYRDMPYEMMIPWVILAVVVVALTLFYLTHLRRRAA